MYIIMHYHTLNSTVNSLNVNTGTLYTKDIIIQNQIMNPLMNNINKVYMHDVCMYHLHYMDQLLAPT